MDWPHQLYVYKIYSTTEALHCAGFPFPKMIIQSINEQPDGQMNPNSESRHFREAVLNQYSRCYGRDAHLQRRQKASCVAQRIVGRVERDGVNGSRLTINMADTEFEEFRHYFERLPQHIKAPAQSYT